jgi:hypothetical protein
MDTPSSREIRTFFHFERLAKVRSRLNIAAFSRSLGGVNRSSERRFLALHSEAQ